MDSLEQRVAELAREVAEMRSELSRLRDPKPRAAVPRIEDAIAATTHGEILVGTQHAHRFHRGRCVYLLLDQGQVVYVGRSRNGYATRSASHEDKPHDAVVVVDVTVVPGARGETAFASLEAALIATYSPVCNIAPLSAMRALTGLWRGHPVLAAVQRAALSSPYERGRPPPGGAVPASPPGLI